VKFDGIWDKSASQAEYTICNGVQFAQFIPLMSLYQMYRCLTFGLHFEMSL